MNNSSQTSVPLLDLKAQYAQIRDEIRAAVDRVLESQYFILGPEVDALERELAEYCGANFAVGVSSGTDALLLSLMAYDVGPGDEVITTPFTFFATIGAILRLGAVPILADIEPDYMNIDVARIESLVTKRTRAILPVHLFGRCAEMETVLAVAEKYGIPVIEDAAQAIGAEYEGRRAGSMGECGCFSFFPSKNLGGIGEGGLITCKNPEIAEKLKALRNQGSKARYHHMYVGGNFRLDAIQAAALRVKLKRLDLWTAGRIANAAYYTSALDPRVNAHVRTPTVAKGHVFNQYVIRCENRDNLREFLAQNGVGAEIYYPIPTHLQECFPKDLYKSGDFPYAEAAAADVLALPIFPELTQAQKDRVIALIAEFYATTNTEGN